MASSMAKIKTLFTEFIGLKSQRETIEKRESELKKTLSAIVETDGYTDDKGSEYIDFKEPIEGFAGLKRERRVYQSLDEEKAMQVLAKKKLTALCTRTITVVDQDAVQAAFYDGKLTQDDIDAMFTVKINYAFIPRKS
ncbi:MAG TPA: hypothetical protein VFI41_04695 [Gemmatimonadales bacterium]|nr:hypothetical protein [Gemmatimonadales bacterium]